MTAPLSMVGNIAPWRSSCRLVSLLEMLEINANSFVNAVVLTARLEEVFSQMLRREEDAQIAKVHYHKANQLFGEPVEIKFPEVADDIKEAGKCLALDRSTATVFHLMRVLEVGVARFATKLKATIRTDQAWGLILGEVKNE